MNNTPHTHIDVFKQFNVLDLKEVDI